MTRARESHGMSKHPAYQVWAVMLRRCHNPKNARYPAYGGRGIAVCDAWRRSFVAFWTDMGATWAAGLSVERINNSAGYRPGNCRWATPAEQSRNTRRNQIIDTPWGRMCIADAAAKEGVGYWTMHSRLRRGRLFFNTTGATK
jgi:hypothetical protein